MRVVRRARVKPSRRGLDQRSISLRDSVFSGKDLPLRGASGEGA